MVFPPLLSNVISDFEISLRKHRIGVILDSKMDDDFPLLSEGASAALLEVFTNATYYGELATDANDFKEDWRLSQFWYTEHTADVICSEIETQLKEGSVACVSCPTIFRRLSTRGSCLKRRLFEYDKRFASLGNFVYYDYNEPQEILEEYHHSFDIVIADPPYLVNSNYVDRFIVCLERGVFDKDSGISQVASEEHDRIKDLFTNRSIACSGNWGIVIVPLGEVMRDVALQKAKLRPVKFRPEHENKLGNDFMLYTNQSPSPLLGGFLTSEG